MKFRGDGTSVTGNVRTWAALSKGSASPTFLQTKLRAIDAPAAVADEAERFMATINHSAIPAKQIVSLVEFVEGHFLPEAKKRLKPSTLQKL